MKEIIALILVILLVFLLVNNNTYILDAFNDKPKNKLVYEPDIWNKKYVQQTHNCYEYALNDLDQEDINDCQNNFKQCNVSSTNPYRSKPGHYRSQSNSEPKLTKKPKYKCKEYIYKTLADNPSIYKVKSIKSPCKKNYYKIALVTAPGRDYHYYRQDSNGYWSHKDGMTPATNKDADGKIITDPKDADRFYRATRNFSDFCGYFCVPENETKKTYHSHP